MQFTQKIVKKGGFGDFWSKKASECRSCRGNYSILTMPFGIFTCRRKPLVHKKKQMKLLNQSFSSRIAKVKVPITERFCKQFFDTMVF